jgi:DNA topoisomerase II
MANKINKIDVVTVADYIRNEWPIYADYDNRRALPHLIDGLKTTHRKIIHTCLSMPKSDMPRVSQLASKASEMTAYHHGEASMMTSIVGLAQDFPGANNVPWLAKQGQFGTRLSNKSGGYRYIHTKLHENWHTMFKKEDQEIVNYLYDDNDRIEPEYFIPVIPTILLNPGEGIGNGYKSDILGYNTADVVKACKEVLKHGKVKTPLVPYIKNWHGTIEKEDRQVLITGILKIINTTRIEITELPPKYDNDKFKKVLNALLDDKSIKDYHNMSTEDGWKWVIECPREFSAKGVEELSKIFKLTEKMTENFVFWSPESDAPVTVNSPEEVVEMWYKLRIPLYAKSLAHQIESITADIVAADLKARFIEWCLTVDFKTFTKQEFIDKAVAGVDGLLEDKANTFVALPMYRITKDEVKKLEDEMDALLNTLDALEALTPELMMEQNLKTVKAA